MKSKGSVQRIRGVVKVLWNQIIGCCNFSIIISHFPFYSDLFSASPQSLYLWALVTEMRFPLGFQNGFIYLCCHSFQHFTVISSSIWGRTDLYLIQDSTIYKANLYDLGQNLNLVSLSLFPYLNMEIPSGSITHRPQNTVDTQWMSLLLFSHPSIQVSPMAVMYFPSTMFIFYKI